MRILRKAASARKTARHGLPKRETMDSVDHAKNKDKSANDVGPKYNFQHFVFVTKYRYKMFRNPKTVQIVKGAFYDAAQRHKLVIKELSFGDDYAHVHLEVSMPCTMTVSYVAQLLKGFSSYTVFKEIPNHRLRYPQGHFWGADFSSGSIGPRNEETLRNYIRKQDISGQLKLAA